MTGRRLIAGNWKMHGVAADLDQVRAIAAAEPGDGIEVALCLPATLVERAVRAAPALAIGGQDVHAAASGAHTGCISAAMLVDAGARLVIVGHSERREAQHEQDADVRAKASAALAAGLDVILCVGESDAVRDAGRAIETVVAQLEASLPDRVPGPARLAIAYEPIWAIGTGKVPTLADIGDMHAALRRQLVASFGAEGSAMPILYGGSVKPSNAADIFGVVDVGGALVGGASLTADDFLPIVAAAGTI